MWGQSGRPASGVALLYHRIAELEADPWGLAVTPTRFEEQVQALRGRFVPLSLAALVEGARSGHRLRQGVAVTFDDGYQDNLTVAKPILERHDVPATVFVVSGHIDSDRPFWWDELVHLCTTPPDLAGSVTLLAGGETVECRPDQLTRDELCHVLGRRLRMFDSETRDQLLQQLRVLVGVVSRPAHETMTSEMLQRLDDDLVEVGAHTVSHPLLSRLPQREQVAELRDSKARLESILDRPVVTCSYPHGDASRLTRSCARHAGFAYACTTSVRPITRRTGRLAIPRLVVGDWPADELVARVAALLADG